MGNTLRNIGVGLALTSAAVLTAGCAETYGEGSILTDNQGCDPISSTLEIDEKGDTVLYGIDDLSVGGDTDWIDAGRVEDKLRIEAVGIAGRTAVDEVVFRGEDLVIEVVDTLPVDWSQQKDDEFRVDISDLRGERGGPDHSFAFEIREGNALVPVTVEALTNGGANVTLSQDCVAVPTVTD